MILSDSIARIIAGIPFVNKTDTNGNPVNGIAGAIGVFVVSLFLH